jgi:hypothetical protein
MVRGDWKLKRGKRVADRVTGLDRPALLTNGGGI